MKRKIATLAAAFAAAVVVSATETTEEMAITAANNWAAANAETLAPTGEALSAIAERDADGTLLWWVVPFSGGGAIIASPDTRIEPIISSLPSYNGSIPEGHPLRVMLKLDMRNRLKMLGNEEPAKSSSGPRIRAKGQTAASEQAALPDAVAASAEKATAKWNNLVPTGPRLRNTDKVIYDPLAPDYILGICPGFEYGGVYTHWNQSECPYSKEPDKNCYNYHTPRAMVCGCVATAGAAVMQYFQSPGPIYNATNTCSVGEPGAEGSYSDDFTMIGATNRYDWSILPENLGGTNTAVMGEINNTFLTREQVDLIGRATYDMGVGVQMAWAEGGSGSLVSYLATAFRDYYGFADARAVSDFDEWVPELPRRLIYAQVRNSIPVPLGIRNSEGGHAVLAIGYGQDKAGDSYTRVFMGWAGSHDAWYCLPDVDDYPVITQIVTMVNPDNTKSVPIVGRVVTESGKGAAYVKVDVGGVTNAVTDANGFWAVRINEENLVLDANQTVVHDVTTTNKCLVGDTKKVKEIKNAMAAYEANIASFTETDSATVGGVDVDDAYKRVITVSTNEIEEVVGGITTNYLCIITNTTVKVRRYAVQVSCADATLGATPVDTGVGAYAFDVEDANSSTLPLMYSIPDDVKLTIPDGKALVAFPGTEAPDNVMSNAIRTGKMVFMLSGHPGTKAYNDILNYISTNPSDFNSQYVLYIIEPGKDTYTLIDGDPSFGVFDPYSCNSQAPDRWAFYNGRLAYLNVTNAADGVSGDEIQAVLDEGALEYAKLHSDITITVDPGISGIATNGFEMTPEVRDWNNRLLYGYGTFTDCFTNGQTVAFTAPSVITNNNYVLEPTGWVLYDTADTEKIHALFSEWQEVGEECGDEIDLSGQRLKDNYWKNKYGESYPDDFVPPASENIRLWTPNDTSDPSTYACAEFLLNTNDVNWTLWWWKWALSEVCISASTDSGSIAVNGDTVQNGCVWVPYGTTITVTATADPWMRFNGWMGLPSGVDGSTDTVSFDATNSCSIRAIFARVDEEIYSVNFSSNPAEVSARIKKIVKGQEPVSPKGNCVYEPPCYMTLEMPINWTNDVGEILQCTGWSGGSGSIPATGTGNSCTFALTNDSTIVWNWTMMPTISNAPPPTPEGPGGSQALTVGNGNTTAQIANTVKGWWYGLYSSTSLANDATWTLVPGTNTKKKADDDNVLLELSAEWDTSEPMKFFKIIATETEPF